MTLERIGIKGRTQGVNVSSIPAKNAPKSSADNDFSEVGLSIVLSGVFLITV